MNYQIEPVSINNNEVVKSYEKFNQNMNNFFTKMKITQTRQNVATYVNLKQIGYRTEELLEKISLLKLFQ